MRTVEVAKISFHGMVIRVRLANGERPVINGEDIEVRVGSASIVGRIVGVDKDVVSIERRRMVQK